MRNIIICFLNIFACFQVAAQSEDLQSLYTKAMDARGKGDVAGFYENIMKAHEIHPYHQGILYQAGIAAAMNNKNKEAIKFLKEAIEIQSDFVLDIPELKSLKGDKEFEEIRKIKADASQVIISSDTAFTLTDRSLHVEGVAAAPDNIFYCGSIRKRKIIKIEDGIAKDFTRSAQEGLCSVFGIKVDAKKKILWASSSPMEEMENYNSLLPSAVFKYDLNSGKLLKKFLPENPSLQLVLGDLTLSKKGDVYVSDSKSNLIFKVNESNGKLEQFFSSDDFWNLQGITFSDDDKFLFISDYIKGVFRLEIDKMELIQLTKSFDLSLKAIDGLSFYKNTLIAIQNGIKPIRVTQYTLNKENDALISYAILDQNNPAFNEPTLGCVYDNTFYYVANSQWGAYDKEHHIKPVNELQDIVILKTVLKK
jgi:hypothetical protein